MASVIVIMNPQLENGYTRIANELLEAIIAYRIPGEQMQCFLFILRKTYGHSKKEDKIPNSQFCKMTGLVKGNVSRALKELSKKQLVIKNDNTVPTTYRINKNYSQWIRLSKKQPVIKKATKVIKKDNKSYQKRGTQKKKETIQKKYIKDIFCCVISYLNSKTGKSFRLVESNTKFIRARIAEGYELDDLIQVIDNQVTDEWFCENPKYLRPQTLFNSEKFSGYLANSPKNEQKNQIMTDEEIKASYERLKNLQKR